MSQGDYYWIFNNDAAGIAEATGLGFLNRNVSTNGLWFVTDKGDNEEVSITNFPAKMSFITEPMAGWPCMSWDDVRALIKYKQSTPTSDDGFKHISKTVLP